MNDFNLDQAEDRNCSRKPQMKQIPGQLCTFLQQHQIEYEQAVHPVSSTAEACVVEIEHDPVLFVKTGRSEAIRQEADMDAWFEWHGIGTKVLFSAVQKETGYLLLEQATGVQGIDPLVMSHSEQCARIMGEALKQLHFHTLHQQDDRSWTKPDKPDLTGKDNSEERETGAGDPSLLKELSASYLSLVRENAGKGKFDPSYYELVYGRRPSKEKCLKSIEEHKGSFCDEVLIHGDFCLPNLFFNPMLFEPHPEKGLAGNESTAVTDVITEHDAAKELAAEKSFAENREASKSGSTDPAVCHYIDCGQAGFGNRHVDLFWGCWSLLHNFGKDRQDLTDIFLNAYGKDNIDKDLLEMTACCECFG